MIIAIVLLYPLLLRQYKYSVEIIFPLLTLFLLGYLYKSYNSISEWKKWAEFAYSGVLRAVAEMAMGGSLYRLSEIIAIKQPRWICSDKVWTKSFVTLFKMLCYAVVIVFAYGFYAKEPIKTAFNLHALLFCALGILLSFSQAGYCIPDCKTTRFLGRISLPIFIFHGFIRLTLADRLEPDISVKLFAEMIVLSIIASVLLMYLSDFIASRLKRLFAKA